MKFMENIHALYIQWTSGIMVSPDQNQFYKTEVKEKMERLCHDVRLKIEWEMIIMVK